MKRNTREAEKQLRTSPPAGDRKLRVIAVRSGTNPNSSSLGVNVTWLLAGGVLAGLLSLVGGTLARWVISRREGERRHD